MKTRTAKLLGADVSTSRLKLGVRADDGDEDLVSMAMKGGTLFLNQNAFCLEYLPGLILDGVSTLRQRGWTFDKPGRLSVSFRQHDMQLVGQGGTSLAPALSWECSAAEDEVTFLRANGVESVVGRIEPRFVLPKAAWLLKQIPHLRESIETILTSGDFLAWKLTGQLRLATSDALSNSLLHQRTKCLATHVLEIAGLRPRWFPNVINSGELLGIVSPSATGSDIWSPVRELLRDWSVYAGLGDNAAAALGAGLSDKRMVVISAGSSGTATRLTDPSSRLRGNAVCFEYFYQRLLLMMTHRCCNAYEQLLREIELVDQYERCNTEAMTCNPTQIVRLRENDKPIGWQDFSVGAKVASMQFSIAVELLTVVKALLGEVEGGENDIERFFLTGGLSQSTFFCSVLHAGLKTLAPRAAICIGARTGPLASQQATVGAMVNAAVAGRCLDSEVLHQFCPLRELEQSPHALGECITDQLTAILE